MGSSLTVIPRRNWIPQLSHAWSDGWGHYGPAYPCLSTLRSSVSPRAFGRSAVRVATRRPSRADWNIPTVRLSDPFWGNGIVYDYITRWQGGRRVTFWEDFSGRDGFRELFRRHRIHDVCDQHWGPHA